MRKPKRTKKEIFEEQAIKASKRHIGHEVAFWSIDGEGTKVTRTGKLLRMGHNPFGSFGSFIDVNTPFPHFVYFGDLQSCQCGKLFVYCSNKGHYFQDGESSPCECGKFANIQEGKAAQK